jgi:hypothetical protein
LVVLHDNVLKLKKLCKVLESVAQYVTFLFNVVSWQGDKNFVRCDDSCEKCIYVFDGCCKTMYDFQNCIKYQCELQNNSKIL